MAWIYVACWAVAQFVLTCVWRVRRDRASAWLAGAWLTAGLVAACVSYLVVTSTEQIAAMCEAMADAIDAGEVAIIEQRLADEFEAGDMNKAEFLDAVAAALSRFRVDRPRLSGFEVEFPTESTAVATFGASCRVRAQRMYGQIPSRWRLRLRKSGEAWLVTTIQSLPVPPLNVTDLRHWLR